jgi:hypothetical protein
MYWMFCIRQDPDDEVRSTIIAGRGLCGGRFGTSFHTMNPVWLVLQGPTVPDTVVMRMVPPDLSWFERVTGVASGLNALIPWVLLLVILAVAARMRTSLDQTRGRLDGATKDLKQLVEATSRIAHDMAAVSEMVRTDLSQVHGTVAYASQRTRDAVEALADRVDQFTETVAVVQDEAQDVIVHGLAAVRGVRAGVRAILAPSAPMAPRRRRAEGRDDAPDEQRPGPRLKRPRDRR